MSKFFNDIKSIDRIVLSSDTKHHMFIEFWPLVATAWKKFFPEVTVTLALLTERDENDALVEECRKHGEVHIVKPIPNAPIANQAKVARHIVASKMGDDVCCLHDIDSCPLNRYYTESFVSRRKKDTLLRVGREVLHGGPHHGKFPMSHVTAEGYIWKEIINPNNLSDRKLLESWVGMAIFTECGVERRFLDGKESLGAKWQHFSDESLLRALLSKWEPQRFTDVQRSVDGSLLNVTERWLDRSWWPGDPKVIYRKLINGDYVEANMARPMYENWVNLLPLVHYIYGHTDESIVRLELDNFGPRR
tara:strand:- start:6281 stop:7195 length:915 start_codon:yes stop_codon:yes gene_type:complete